MGKKANKNKKEQIAKNKQVFRNEEKRFVT